VSRTVLECLVSAILVSFVLFHTLTLYVYAPFQWVQTECLQSALLAQPLGLVDVFVAAVISRAWVAFRVLVF